MCVIFLLQCLCLRRTFFCGKPKAFVLPVLTFNGFSSWGGGEKGKEWLQDILTHRLLAVHVAAHTPDCSVRSLGTLDAFYFLPGSHWHKSREGGIYRVDCPRSS